MNEPIPEFLKALEKFREKTFAQEIEWKIQSVSKGKPSALVVPYIKKEAVFSRLDKCFGPCGWQNTMERGGFRSGEGGFVCRLELLVEFENDLREWIGKADAGADSSFDPFKGGASDSFKRAAKAWGYARDLDDFPKVYIELENNPYYKKDDPKSRQYIEEIHETIFPQLDQLAKQMRNDEIDGDFHKFFIKKQK